MSEAIGNAAKRAAGFAALLEAMIAGDGAEAVKSAKRLIDDARPEDLVGAVDAAIARGVESAVLKPAVSRLVNLLSTPLKRFRCKPPDGERLFSSLMAENEGLARALERGKALAKAINGPGPESLGALSTLILELGAVESHYRKKENVLFPWFEARYPEYRCVRLMWEIQDDTRRTLKDIAHFLESAMATLAIDPGRFDPKPINQALGRLYFDLNANIFREECALFPVMMGLITRDEGERLFGEMREYGYAFLDEATIARLEKGRSSGQKPAIGVGAIPADVLGAMFSALPVDMTWVDANDKVRWFSDSPHRIFPRSPSILGRDVRNCHPGASVGRVVAIIDAFRTGTVDRESFWIDMKGRFIYIEYFALRSPLGVYLGVLEASQDLTEHRSLTGEKRLTT